MAIAAEHRIRPNETFLIAGLNTPTPAQRADHIHLVESGPQLGDGLSSRLAFAPGTRPKGEELPSLWLPFGLDPQPLRLIAPPSAGG